MFQHDPRGICSKQNLSRRVKRYKEKLQKEELGGEPKSTKKPGAESTPTLMLASVTPGQSTAKKTKGKRVSTKAERAGLARRNEQAKPSGGLMSDLQDYMNETTGPNEANLDDDDEDDEAESLPLMIQKNVCNVSLNNTDLACERVSRRPYQAPSI